MAEPKQEYEVFQYPKMIDTMSFCGGALKIEVPKKPNFVHKFMLKIVFGIVYEGY